MPTLPAQLDHVSLTLKANIYFDGNVISHTVTSTDGPKRTVGFIRPGTYHFTTNGAERMDVVAGSCRVKQATENAWTTYAAGQSFQVPANSAFDIAVDAGSAEYLCTYE